MTRRINITYPTTLILQALVNGNRHGFDIVGVTDLPSGTVYPALRRLERAGLVESTWEDVTIAQGEQRPPRRYYTVNAAGEEALAVALKRFRRLDGVLPRLLEREPSSDE
jgi:DNA-binding PadR family transcriptional regulator